MSHQAGQASRAEQAVPASLQVSSKQSNQRHGRKTTPSAQAKRSTQVPLIVLTIKEIKDRWMQVCSPRSSKQTCHIRQTKQVEQNKQKKEHQVQLSSCSPSKPADYQHLTSKLQLRQIRQIRQIRQLKQVNKSGAAVLLLRSQHACRTAASSTSHPVTCTTVSSISDSLSKPQTVPSILS